VRKTSRKQTSKHVQAPLAMTRSMGSGQPNISHAANGAIRIRFRELIFPGFELDSGIPAGNFQRLNSVNVNPGLDSAFPWLSTIAANYDQYEVHHIGYEYVPGLSAVTTGFFYSVPDYDVTDAYPLTPQQALNQLGTSSVAVWKEDSIRLRVPAAMAVGPRRFIRQANTMNDNRLSDVAVMHFFVSGFESEFLTAQVWVEYDISLYAPQITVSRAQKHGAGTKSAMIAALTTSSPNLTPGASAVTSLPVTNISSSMTYNGLPIKGPHSGVQDTTKVFETTGLTPNMLRVSIDPQGTYKNGTAFATHGAASYNADLQACNSAGTPLQDQSFISKAVESGLTVLMDAALHTAPLVGKPLVWMVNELFGKKQNPGHTGPIVYCLKDSASTNGAVSFPAAGGITPVWRHGDTEHPGLKLDAKIEAV